MWWLNAKSPSSSSVSDEHRVRAVVLGLNVEGYDRVETALEALEHPLLDEAVGLLGSPLAGDIQGVGDVAGPHDAILGQLPQVRIFHFLTLHEGWNAE